MQARRQDQPSAAFSAAPPELNTTAIAAAPAELYMSARHTRTRAGCRTCKDRKVKCDEERPSCGNCLKHRVECGYLQEAAATSAPRSPVSISLPGVDELSNTPGGFSVLDLELLHHYTTSTSLTLSTEPLMRDFWRITIPQVGFSNLYVLKCILSLSALHLARFRSSQRDFYVNHALACHHTSSSLMRLVPTITADNYTALLSFTWLTTYFALARPRDSGSLLVIHDGVIPDWLNLFRGVRGFQRPGESTEPSPLVAILSQSGMRAHMLWEASTFDKEPLADLLARFRSQITDPHKLEVLCEAVEFLKRSYGLVFGGSYSDDYKLRSLFIWLYKISDDYVDLLRQDDSEALCVLAFFCVLVQRFDYLWWIEGWGRHLIERVYNLLDSAYRLWIQWPIEEIGWVQRR